MNDDPQAQQSCGSLPPTGDRGQRYEVRATRRETGEQIVIGWTPREDGGPIAESARLWPAMRDVVVIDREAGR